jgi:mono/diheme cytochrome c family protein
MKKQFIAITLCAFVLGVLQNCTTNSTAENKTEPSARKEAELIKRGEYLVTVAACNECHSPKAITAEGRVPDPKRLLSGHPQDEKLPPIFKEALASRWALWNEHSTAVAGPWGVSFAANLTPDDTGIGNWSFEQFKTAIRHGKYKGLEGSRDLLPPMPWKGYSRFTDEDLKAIFSYLKSLPPVSNLVPIPIAPPDL